MSAAHRLPVALTVAGSDSGGGAGIQADLNTFAALGVHGTSAITCVTAQNPKRVLGVQACTPAIVRGQLEAVFDQLPPAAVKTGMLFSAPIIREVAAFLSSRRGPALVVDPVMVATSGALLLQPSARKALCAQLLPLATLLTPNLPEAEALLDRKLTSVEDLRSAARELQSRFGCAVLLKGGHLRGLNEAVDIFREGTEEWLLQAPFIRGVSTHGTGCTYSAAITAYLARGATLSRAVAQAKEFITQAIARSQTVAGHSVLNWKAGQASTTARKHNPPTGRRAR
jgi:hydroxymethylpyrimidine/phosphomethylpyrimidine kinase